jgi:hypothetical protein
MIFLVFITGLIMYTHYFEITKRPGQVLWAQLMLDVQKLLNNLPTCEELEQLGVENNDRIILRGPMGDKKPVCNSQRISFNGDAAKGMYHESFTLLPKKMVDSCKTDRKPYDFIVCAVLILAYNHLRYIVRVGSDGDAYDWDPALSYVRQYILPGAILPVGIKDTLLPSASESFEKPKKLNSFLDNLKCTESTIGDFYFS